ncbi:PREDICTED: nucleoside diphosphate kinase 6 isoform X2 [Myotis davidii]|uniref:nucleoside diphosphate kinase 6 isoform X2 n=1 Tax=Myotis davidii TaxID=225400 RepID=UPI0003EC6286|nr:PREDICTED: nucleoside diphosphate kinase 6 isoform X2 [Myotis davidii]
MCCVSVRRGALLSLQSCVARSRKGGACRSDGALTQLWPQEPDGRRPAEPSGPAAHPGPHQARCRRSPADSGGRFFYQRLVEFMASGPIRAYILAHPDAIQLWRTLMGPTRVFRARHVAPDSIRGSFGLTDTRNTTHGSDSVASASREIAAFFPDFSERRWYEEEEPQWRWGSVRYSPEGGVHCAAGTGGQDRPGPGLWA